MYRDPPAFVAFHGRIIVKQRFDSPAALLHAARVNSFF